MNGKQIADIAQNMFGTSKITPEQLSYVLDTLKPSTYLLRNHTIRNHPITFMVSNRDSQKKQAHRPWQTQIINDQHKNLAIIKSRQLG